MDQRDIATLGILGVLAERETATIREVRDTLKHNFGRYWGAGTGVLSPTMTRLKENGHVELTSIDDGGDYRITESGNDRLRSLLRTSLEGVSHSPLQVPLVMKIGFLHNLSDSEQRQEIDELADQLWTARAGLVDVESAHGREVNEIADTGYRGELIRLRISVLDALLEWLETLEIGSQATD